MVRKILEGQIFQTIYSAFFLFLILTVYKDAVPKLKVAMVLSVSASLLHQLFVAFIWRIELHTKKISHKFKHGFLYYKIGFILLSFLRIASIIIVSIINKESINISASLRIIIIAVLAIPCHYAFFSVIKYFGINRAFGKDHFDESYKHKKFVRKGIYRFTYNGMYLFAVLFIYFIPIALASRAGLILAAFTHIHLWIHYFCTEKPDIVKIYGTRKDDN
ncbi:MAG: hypothetical protein KAS64_01635 [Spirochaetes bacterium]|nr:hypothetical protein [Spirochaetota bacterium]